jgi:hypothetical protein
MKKGLIFPTSSNIQIIKTQLPMDIHVCGHDSPFPLWRILHRRIWIIAPRIWLVKYLGHSLNHVMPNV